MMKTQIGVGQMDRTRAGMTLLWSWCSMEGETVYEALIAIRGMVQQLVVLRHCLTRYKWFWGRRGGARGGGGGGGGG